MKSKAIMFVVALFLMVLILLNVSFAMITWIQTYDGGDHDNGQCVIETSDGGFALAGYAYLGGKDDVWLVKTDASGTMQWKQMYGGTEWDEAYSVVQTSDGGFAIAGLTWSFGSGDGDFWLVKTDASGVVQWNQTYGGTTHEEGHSMVQTSDGGFAIAGSKLSMSPIPGTNYDVWLVKTDASGTMQWNQTYLRTGFDEAYSMVQTSDGGYAIAGSTFSNDTGTVDVWLVKTDSSGNELWNQTYGGTDPDCGYSVIETSDDGYAIVGDAGSSFSDDCDVLLVKTDAVGNKLWNQTYGGTSLDAGRCVIETSDGGLAIVGSTKSFGSTVGTRRVWLVKTDSSGNELWNQTYGGILDVWDMDWGHSVVETSDGGYAIAGNTQTTLGTFKDDFLLIKTNEYGVFPTPSPSPSPSPSPAPTAAPTPTPTPTSTPPPSPTPTPEPSPSPSPTASPSPSPTPPPEEPPTMMYIAVGIGTGAFAAGVAVAIFLRRGK